MKEKSLDSISKNIETKKEKLRLLREEIAYKEKTQKKLLREQRDNFRYVLGGLVQNKCTLNKYPLLMHDLYSIASSKDKLKFIKLSLISDDEAKIIRQNKKECRESVKEITFEQLTTEDKNQLQKIIESFNSITVHTKKKKQLYGKKGEVKVYLGENYCIHISDSLAAYLRDNEGFLS